MLKFEIPRWYQDLSLPQMRRVFVLERAIKCDYEETVTGRTQRLLREIGITSTFVKIPSRDIKKLQKASSLDPVGFLSEIYRYITGNYFEDEAYKKFYDCNERLVLTAIAVLKLQETIIELHRRLPMGEVRKLPPKPKPPKPPPRRPSKSPYLDEPFEPPNWRLQRSQMEEWRRKSSSVVKPQVNILPVTVPAQQNRPSNSIVEPQVVSLTAAYPSEQNRKSNSIVESQVTSSPATYSTKQYRPSNSTVEPQVLSSIASYTTEYPSTSTVETQMVPHPPSYSTEYRSSNSIAEPDMTILSVNQSTDQQSSSFYETQQSRPSSSVKKSKIKRSRNFKKPLKRVNKVVKREKENLPPIMQVQSTENSESEEEETVDTLINRLKRTSTKVYPRGRENLSIKWQSWFYNQDEDFNKLAKQANTLLNKVRETTNLIVNPDVCDNCCACRQTRAVEVNKRQSQVPHLIIDSLILDEDGRKNVIGSLTLNSPTASPTESMLNLPRIIPSREKILKKPIISGIVIDEDSTKYICGGIIKDRQYIPEKVQYLPEAVKNIPPCGCRQEKIVNTQNYCDEKDGCIAKKYIKNDSPCYKNCFDEHNDNGIFLDFENACRERDKREMKAHLPINDVKKIEPIDEQDTKEDITVVKCEKCLKTTGKCQKSSFKDIYRRIEDEKLGLEGRKRKKSDIKEYKENIKFSFAGIGNYDDEFNQFILSDVTVHTPITISAVSSSESDVPYSPPSQHRHWSVTSFTPKSRKIKPHNPVAKKRPSKVFQDGINELLEQLREFDDIKMSMMRSLSGKNDEIAVEEAPVKPKKFKTIRNNPQVERKIPKVNKNRELKKNNKNVNEHIDKKDFRTEKKDEKNDIMKNKIIDDTIRKSDNKNTTNDTYINNQAIDNVKNRENKVAKKSEIIRKNSQVEGKNRKISNHKKSKKITDRHVEEHNVDREETHERMDNSNEMTNFHSEEQDENTGIINNKIPDNTITKRDNTNTMNVININNNEAIDDLKNTTKEVPEIVNREINEINQEKKIKEKIDNTSEIHTINATNNLNNQNENRKSGETKVKKQNLFELLKTTLAQMAEEGFILPMLPQSYAIPQLQAWIMFREGFNTKLKDKREQLEKTKKLWTDMESSKLFQKITAPPFEMPKNVVTHADIQKIQKQLQHKKQLFHSKVRKLRVLQSRAMWNLMDYELFPSWIFKRTYFVYQAAKESDGKIVRPHGYVPST